MSKVIRHQSTYGLFRFLLVVIESAEVKKLYLGNLNPIYERELDKLDVHQVRGRRNVLETGREAKDVGMSIGRGERCACPLSVSRGRGGELDARRRRRFRNRWQPCASRNIGTGAR